MGSSKIPMFEGNNNFYSKEEDNSSKSSDSEENEIMFLGITKHNKGDSTCQEKYNVEVVNMEAKFLSDQSETEEVPIPLFSRNNYADWRKTMKTHLKAMGTKVWRVVAKKKSKQVSKEDYKNNSIALKVIKRSLTNDVKKKVGYHTSARFLWVKLEETYQEKHDSTKIEVKSNNSDSSKCSEGIEERLEEEKNHISRKETIKEKEEKGSEGSLETSSEENDFINDLIIRSKAYEGISNDKENKKDDSSQFSEYNEDYESSDYNSFDDDENSLKEKEDNLTILKNEKKLLTKDEDFITLRKEFSSSLLEVEFGSEPALVYVKTILKKTLDEFETVNKMNELLQELWMELKESIKKIKEHSMKKKKKLETLRDKYLTLSREHQEAKSKIAMQEDLLIEREEEIKNLSEVNAQQQDKIGEANKVIYGFSNLATSIEILVKDHEQKKVEVTNPK